jgi:hypothetical protein
VAIYDSTGTVMACGILPRQDETTQQLQITGNFNVPLGATSVPSVTTLDVSFGETGVDLAWTGLVADPTCETDGPDTTRKRSCVVSIARNFDCKVNFGYRWTLLENPWLNVKYGGASGSASVETCFGFTSHVGRSLQVFDRRGRIMGCKNLVPNEYKSHPGYSVNQWTSLATTVDATTNVETPVPVGGNVHLTFEPGSNEVQLHMYDIVGDSKCNLARNCACESTSCAIQIYDATSCDDLSNGALWDQVNQFQNPWSTAYYLPGKRVGHSVTISYLTSFEETEGKALVMHNEAGEIIGCTILGNDASYFTDLDLASLDSASALAPSLALAVIATLQALF